MEQYKISKDINSFPHGLSCAPVSNKPFVSIQFDWAGVCLIPSNLICSRNISRDYINGSFNKVLSVQSLGSQFDPQVLGKTAWHLPVFL